MFYVGGKPVHVIVRIEHRAPSITGCWGEDLLLTALKRHEAEESYAVTSFMVCTPYQKHYRNEVKMYGSGRGRVYGTVTGEKATVLCLGGKRQLGRLKQ